MRFFNALVEHFHQYVVVVMKFNHQFLSILHSLERIIVDQMSVVEE